MASLIEQTEDRFKAASVLALVEVRSAIRRRQYSGDILRTDAEVAISSLREESRRIIQHPFSPSVLELAAVIVDRQNLRALDSIQLATAILAHDLLDGDDRFTLVTSDQKLLTAALAEGLEVWDPAVESEL